MISKSICIIFHCRSRLHGSGAIKDGMPKKPFMDQFPYKTCQRGYQKTRERPKSMPPRPKSFAREDPGENLLAMRYSFYFIFCRSLIIPSVRAAMAHPVMPLPLGPWNAYLSAYLWLQPYVIALFCRPTE